MIDLHIHLLPGLDDGPRDIDSALELARACVAEGVTAVAATPHVSGQYPTRPAALAQALATTRAAIEQAQIPLTVHGGAEIAIDQLHSLSDDDLLALTIGSGHILLETPYAAWPMEIDTHLMRLATLGIRAIVAHPERSAGVQAPGGLDRLERVVARGAYVQVTAGSLSGRFGHTAQDTASRLLERELVHIIASDAHNVDRRPPRMAEAATHAGGSELARWLTELAPAAILRGQRLPPRPAIVKRPRTGLLRRLTGRS